MIRSEEISVIVQGPIATDTIGSSSTKEVLSSIRAVLPNAELILSTWKDADLRVLDYDKVVLSDDPGLFSDRTITSSANIYRQITSTSAGLLVATRTYGLKLRSDTSLASTNFVDLWEERESLGFKPRYFSKKILVSAIFTPCAQQCPSPYWVSDFFSFGLINDLLHLWQPPMEEIQRMNLIDEKRRALIAKGKRITPPYNAEQKIILAMLTKSNLRENFETIISTNLYRLIRSEIFIASHFIPVNPTATGINLPNRFNKYEYLASYRNDGEGNLFKSKNIFIKNLCICKIAFFLLFRCIKSAIVITAHRLGFINNKY